MSKKVLIISTTLRAKSNSEVLARAFEQGAREAGHDVEFVSLKGRNIAFCKGCMACQKLGRCVQNDDANEITEKIYNAEVVVWTTPIYYYEMSGQMKTMIDRANCLYSRDYKFRDVYLLTCAADDGTDVDEHAVGGICGWLACFEHASLAGYVFAGGVNAPGEIEGHPALEKAYEMGLNA